MSSSTVERLTPLRQPIRASDNPELESLIDALEEAVRARDEFVAIAAHELRNPMTPILLQVESIKNAASDPVRCTPERLLPRIHLLEQAVQEFIRRSTALLDVTRITAGNVKIERGDHNITQLVQQALERQSFAAQVSGTTIETQIQADVTGHCDGIALTQVTDNLLSNAVKFGSGNPVSVSLEKADDWILLSVRDRGIGISDEDRDRIFQRFERAVTKRQHGGFGIGLWLSNQLVQAMGGMIEVESQQGKGTCFTVRLPVGATEARI